MNMLLRAGHAIIGPSAVIAAGTMGAGAVASFLLTGAWFQYQLLWVVPLMLPIFVISVDTASRIGALNPGRGMFTLISQRTHRSVAWLFLLVNVPVHVLIIMGQLSVMDSALTSAATQLTGRPLALPPIAEAGIPLLIGVFVLWLVFSSGYERLQKVMTALLIAMLICFLLVAIRGFSEWRMILDGFVPQVPKDLPVPGADSPRSASASIISILGSAIAPAALLGMPYLAANAGSKPSALQQSFHRSIINLGFIFGAYAILVMVAGGHSLFSLENNAGFEDVASASAVMQGVFPGTFAPLGPLVFSIGVFIAALTTVVVAAQITVYFMLDTFGRDWKFVPGNKHYRVLVTVLVLGAAIATPFWSFPALLKVVLMMGINFLVIPAAFAVVILLANQREIMGDHRAEWWRNLVLGIGLVVSLALASTKAPYYWSILVGGS
ncbi:putative Cytochrome ba3-putative manganese transport protein MntH [Luminiphilus syltensis NOR5-1B]|uniref:Putative Cytochrome ba3-putative manganese transport protein MntH n=1 Tax=Luminiphilus syltensis NOR5-1B TaxID=565045 RepID=B8KS45_9GAMM|nr:divalent metal cation transporter [Luminiphilus syltensis]EED34775.1 putative Cytochrome ba3-putative manganese transport protein MntH [Luminiphilus syltensis NOR5-1B]